MARSRAIIAALAVACVLAVTACAELPARKSPTPPVPASAVANQVTVRDRAGPVGPAAEKRVLAAVAAEGRADLAQHHLAVLAATGDVDLYRGNSTRLLIDGPATFAAMKQALGKARRRVLLESYMFEDSRIAAELAKLLAGKAAEGVAVALLYDSVGSRGMDRAYFDALRAAGVAVCEFNPINPLRRLGYWDINHRDHRKVLLVDDEVVFTGGINISRAYSSGSLGRSRAGTEDTLRDGWRDTHIELRGPVIEAFARAFADTWRSQGCRGALDDARFFQRSQRSTATTPGTRVVKVLASTPRDPENRIYTSLLAAIEASQRSVHLTMAYFAPGPDMARALAAAARRGIDVVLVLPGRSDFQLVLHAGRSYYADLLAAGVRVHEMDQAVMHAKTAVIDGVFSTVGSSNLDWRSFVANDEINVIVLGDDFGRELEAQFRDDLAQSRPIEREAWQQRGLGQRVMEGVGRLAERLL